MVTIRISRRIVVFTILGVLLAIPAASLASHRFTDVADSNVFHDDIAWLADAAVTKGCNPPDNDEFCPDDAVTRSQMAAFMRRFARYIDAEDGTPAFADAAGDADTLDGLDSSALLGGGAAAVFASANDVELLDNGFTPEVVRSVTFSPPASGTVIVNSTITATDPDIGNSVACSITQGTTLESGFIQRWASGGLDRAEINQVSGTRGFEVTGGGDVTVNLVCAQGVWTTPGTPMEVRSAALSLMFFPG